MVRETHNVCFGQIAQETQVAVKEDTTAVKRDHLKRSTDELSISNYTERNSGYYERSSRLVADTDSYIRRPNHSTSVINNYQTSSNSNINNSVSINSNSDSNNNNNNRNRATRDCRLYRNGPYAISSRTASPSTVLLSDRSVSVATSNNTNSRVPPASWYEATATYTNGPGGSGNAGVSAAGNPATSYSNSPAHNNSATATAISLRNHSSVYGNVTSALALDSGNNNRAIEISNILSNKGVGNNSSKYQRLLKLSSAPRSGSASPTTITGPATMTASSLSATTATKSSCSSFSSTINSNTNNNNLSSSISSVADTNTTASNASGILNAAALAAAAVSESNEVQSNNINTNNAGNNNINSLSNASNSSNNPSSASHHTSRSVAHAHLHGRSTTSSSRSHSRSPSSYSSSHSSSSSSSSASSNSHASSPTAIRDVDNSLSTSRVGPRSLQSAVAVPNSTIPSALNTSGCSIGGNGNSNNSSSGAPIGNPVVHSEDNRPLAIRVRNLPARSSDTSLKDGLFHEYKKHGKVTWVKVVGQNAERYALVCFKKPEDVEKALEVSHDKLFFGCKIEVEPYQGYDVEDNEFRPYEAELDEYHPKSTRTLFIGNLEKDITASELRSHFECFGEIIEIDIKKQGTSAYAFCQYSDIVSVVKAMRKMDGEHLGNNRIKLGFGKSMPTNCVWIDGIAEKISESHLQSQFSRYGAVSKVVIDRLRQLALVLYEQIQYAQTAVKEMRGATLRGRKLQVDFASRECQDAFYDKLDKQTASSRFNRYDSQSRSRASSFSRHQNSNDGCSPSNTPGSSSSSSAGGGTAPTLPSAIVTNSMSTSFAMGPLNSVVGQTSGNSTPARSRGSRSSRHTMDYDYLDSRRFRSYDEYSQGSGASHDEDAPPGGHIAPGGSYSGIGLRSDSPLLSRLGPIVNSNKEPNEVIEVSLSSRRRCDKSPGKQKGDIRIFQKERSHLLEQLEECPSSGDENIVSPRKRIKIDHHSINSNCGLSQPHMLDEQPQHKNSNCDYILHDSIHRKGEVRRLSECSNLSKYPQQTHHHHHSHHSLPHHHHHQQQLSRRPSIDILATGGSLSARHGSTSSTSSNSDHHPPPYQSSTSLPCKRRRIISGGGNVIASNTLVSSSGSGLAPSLNDDYHHHASRGRGHQLHSQHSHEASGGESADGSRPGTPLCDERPEVLPSEPRRVPRDRPREPMVLPLPKFGIHFFQQYRNSMTSNSSSSLLPSSTTYHHHGSSSFTSASAASSTASGSSHILSNSLLSGGGGVSNNNVHSSLSHSFSTATSASSVVAGSSSSYLPSPPTRFPAQWRPHHHHQHHNHGHHGQQHHHTGTTPSSSSSAMISPLRSRSLSSNSSDSDVPGQSSTGSPSLEERIRTLDEMYERWSGGSATSNVNKRHDFNHAPPIWQQNRSVLSADLHHSSSNEIKLNAPSVPASRHKFLDIDVNELQPSEIVKSVLAKKSIFDDDLQRLKKNHWYEPSSDISQLAKNTSNICTSPGLPNLAATKAPVVGCTSNVPNSTGSTVTKPPGGLLQRLSSVSPMNSPQTSMSPYNSPSPSPSITGNVQLLSSITKVTSYTSLSGVISHPPTANSLTSLNSGASSKGLQYPFPSHPPLPSSAAPVDIQPQVPPSSSSTEIVALSKPKTSAVSKSLSVPTTSTGPESRVLTKSVSVPGSTNVGTIKVTTPSTPPLNNAQYTSGISSLNATSNISNNKLSTEDNVSSKDIKSSSSSISSSLASTVKRDKSHKHNHRSSDDKKSMKSERNAEKRKSSNASLSQIAASAAESSDGDDKDLDKSFEKIKQDRDKNDKLQKERQEKRDKEQRKQQEREEKSRENRVRDEREEKDRIEKERLENERLHRERLQRERLEKERIEQEGKERKQKEIEQESRERKEREENERRKREEREREEQLQREKERKIRDERKLQEDHTEGKSKDHHRKKVSGFQLQTEVTSDAGALNQSTQNLFRHDEIEQQNKENSAADPLCGSINHTSDNVITKSGKHRSRKVSRNASPIRNPKRRLSSQDSNASICGVNTNNSHGDDYNKRIRIENQVSGTAQPHTNNPNSINSKVNERHDFKEQNTKEKVAKHQRQSSSSSHKGAHANEKELNSTSSKYHRNKQQKEKQLQASLLTQHSGDSIIVASEHESEIPPINCINRTEADNHLEQETSTLKIKPSSLQSSDEEGPAQPETPPTIKTPSNIRKHKEHGSGNGVSGHHSRHKGNKREREHHREKKRHSISLTTELLTSTISLGCCNATEEEMITANASNLQRRTSAHNTTYIEMNTKCKHDSLLRSAERKASRCSDDGPVGGQQPQTPSNRQSNHGKNHHIARRMLLSSAEDSDDVGDQVDENDDDDSDAATKKTSIFDIPDEGPYVSMYDKVKARSCKNMQKQEEEKKIKAKFSQLKQSRAKREEKKRSASYDGDTDSDLDGTESQNRHLSRGGGVYKSPRVISGGLSSTDDDRDQEQTKLSERERRLESQGPLPAPSVHPNRLYSASDNDSEEQRHLKLQDNIRRLYDGDESSEDELIRRNFNPNFNTNKRLGHHTSRIASDSESQSQSAIDTKFKQEPFDTSADEVSSSPLTKHCQKQLKKEIKNSETLCSMGIKAEINPKEHEIKKEFKELFADNYDKLQPDIKFHKSSVLCSPEIIKVKKHKKSKKRQKTPTHDNFVKDAIIADTDVKGSPNSNIIASPLLSLQADTKNLKILASPCYDAFDELKRGGTLIAHTTSDISTFSEKKRHKDRKEKRREKLRHLNADANAAIDADKIAYEKEKHRLKKSKRSKNTDTVQQNTQMTNIQMTMAAPDACFPFQHKKSGGEKMEDIFGPISDDDDEDVESQFTDSDIGPRDLNCLPARTSSTTNTPGPIVSAALNPYKQEPLTPKSHTVEENEENKQKLCSISASSTPHLERMLERQHRKERRERKRKDREKSRGSELHHNFASALPSKNVEDENSVDLDAAGRALEAQLMEDSDNKAAEDATPSTATTYRSDMTDVFRFSDGDENSIELETSSRQERRDADKEHFNQSAKTKEKKKKKKRSKEEKQSHHHQRRESSSSNNSQQAYSANIAKASNVINKLSVDIQAASEHSQINVESQTASSSPLCKPSPSLPCLVGEDDEDAISTLGAKSIINNTGGSNALCTTPQKLSKETLSLSPHIRDKQMISPLPKTPTTGNATRINVDSNQKKLGTSTPTSSLTNSVHANTTPSPSSNGSSTKFDELNESVGSINSKSSPSLLSTTCSKKKPEIFIPGFDGEIDERISESAVQSISAEFNTTLLDPSADEPKIPIESPPDASKQMEKLEESKSRVTISQEETESAVSALLGESFGNSSADYSLNDDDDGLDSLHTAVAVPESTIAGESEGPDEEAALAAKTIENEVASSAPLASIEEDSEEICKAVQSLRQEEIEIKVDTPLSVRDLQIDTDAEENGEEVDSSGSHCLKIDETAHSNTSSITSDKQDVPVPVSESIPSLTSVATVTVQTSQSSVITKIELPTQTLPAESTSQTVDKKMEYSNMSNVEKPSAHQTAQAIVSSTDVSLVASTVSTTAVSAVASSARSSSVSYISSTPMKTAFTFSPAVTASSTPKQTQAISFKSMSSSQESSYVMQPPTISIPDSAHFAVPQMVVSPRGTINSHHNDTALASSSLPHSPQTSGTNMPPQSPVGNAYIMNTRTQSPNSPRQTSRGNTPIPRQPSPHTSTPPPVIQQQNIVIQRPMQSAVMSPPATVCTQNNSPVTSPSMGQSQRQPSPVAGLQKQSNQLHHQQLSPKASDQEQLTKIKNSSASSVGGSVLNVRSMQQQEQPNSLYHSSKLGIEQHNVLAGQHMLPVSAQKLPAVPTHSTIISKVVTITPQQAQHSAQNVITNTCNVLPPSSTISQKPCKPIYSSTSTATGGNSQKSHQQVMQQTSKTCISSQQSQSTPHSTQVMQSQSPQKQQHMQYTQAQRSQIQQHSPHRHQMQQHMLQIQQQQMIHQHQQKLQQQQQTLISPSQSHSQSTVQQQQRSAGSPQQAQQTQSQQLQSNVIHSAQTPQRFVVQQHIVGVSSQQHSPQPQQPQPQSPVAQKQQQHLSQQQQTSQQQDRQFQIVQSKLQQASSPQHSLSLPKQSESEQSTVDSSKAIPSTTNRAPQTSFEKSAPPSKENSESPSPLTSTINKSSEGVSVICTSTPTTVIAPVTKGPNSVATNLTDSARTAPLTEENVVKMSPIIQDEVEQDSKEDSDYWSAKEVNVETNVTSTVIKKVECVTIPQISTNKEDDKQTVKQPIDNEEKSKTSPSASRSESQNAHIGDQSDPTINIEVQTPASPFATAHNLSADNDTEDETETQQMPAFEQVQMSGGSKSGVRGTASKRGRQSRGSKKVGTHSSASGSAVNVDGGSQQADVAMSSTVEMSGIQTRLRKPVVNAPITRGRKGRPPRNLMLQQQSSSQANQQHSVQTTAVPNVVTTTAQQTPMPVLTAAEKKARNQAAAAALASLSEQQDVYEFHDDSGEENKLSTSTTNLTSSTTTTTDSRPRLILTIKSPAQPTQLVKATEKPASDEMPTVDITPATAKSNDGQNQDTSPKVQSANSATNHTIQQDPLSTETTFANTRKSRRLLEKDRSTIDDIIEDVVRNNATNMALSGSGQAACAINALPKGAQTPPRRSGRNATQPKKVITAEVPTPANPIGRPRKSKERKANDGETEQSSTQNSGTAIEASESEDGTATTTPPATVLPKILEKSAPSTPEKAQIHTTASPVQATTTLPQHPKKKALAAAEIESYNAAVTAAAVTSTNTMPNLHSALPAGGVPMHNTAAPASQKTTGGAADSLNKPLIDSVTGVVSGVKMQQGKEGSLPLAAAASSLPIIAQTRGPMDPKKIMQAAVAAAAAENNQTLPTTQIDNSKVSQKPMIQGAVATPVTALTKPVQAETAAAAAAAATSVATAMLNKSVSVVVKTSASPPIVMQQQIQVTSQSNHSIHLQQHNSQQQQISTQTSTGPATKQPLVVQQQNPVVMHAQQTNVKPPTSLKAHVLNSQKLQQQHQQQQQIIVNQNHSLPKPNGSSAQSQHVIQASIVTRQPIQQQQSVSKQLLVNIPPPTTHSPHGTNVSSVNSPRLQSLPHQSGQQSQCQPQRHLQQQQQAIVIKQNQEIHHSQVLHVVSSKASASTQCKQSTPQILQQQQQQQQANTQYNTYIQGSTSGQHVQQLQKSQAASTLHQQTTSQQKPPSTSLTIAPGILGLPNHPAMIIQAKTAVPTQSPTGSTVVANPHLQQVQHHHHTPSPPLQSQHLPKSLPPTNPLTHNLPSQSGPHVLTNASSASVGTKQQQQQQVPTPSNSAASIASIRTAAPAISPQGQSRVGSLLLPSGMQVPSHFDANTSDANYPGSGAIRGVPTREHYMIYQQMLRSAQQDPLNSTTGLREYEENLMDNSPPLELRRPGSVPRTIAVPHSLQSPQDRATDSPQVAQVYVHNTRIAGHAHYNTNANAPTGYYETSRQLTREPPPAHRSAAALPPTVVVPHPSASGSSPFIASVQPPPAPMQTSNNTSGVSGSLRIERERERECEREREHQLQREKEQILARVGDSHLRANTPPPPTAQMPPHSQPPQPTPQADSLLTLLQRYPVMWQGLLALKTDQAAVQMHFVFGNPHVARASLPCNSDGSTPPLRIAQRMRLEQTQLEGVARKMQFENEHCMLLALPCGRDHADVLQQSRNLQTGFITYLQQKMAAGIVNIPMPGSEQAAYVVHIFPSCDFANENLERAAPDLKNRVAELAHLLIVIATV
ncbi:spen family transcriptional repressor split ends isoform 3-T6 [Glossina fuscipes fuscipes]